MITMPDVIVGKGPAWLRAIEFTLMSEEFLGNKKDPENNRTVKRFCGMVGASIQTIANDITTFMGSQSIGSTDTWEVLHKKTHEGWELSRFKDVICDRYAELVPEGAITPGIEKMLL